MLSHPHRSPSASSARCNDQQQKQHHKTKLNNSLSHRSEMLSVEDLVAKYGENVVRSAAHNHGAKFSELRPEGTLRALEHATDVRAPSSAASPPSSPTTNVDDVGDASSPSSENENAAAADSSNNTNRKRKSDSHKNENDNFDQQQERPSTAGSSPSSQQHHQRPMSRQEFNDAKKEAAWLVAQEECQRLLASVQGECEELLKHETDRDRASSLADNRLHHLKAQHDERMQKEKLHFAERLKKSIEGTRNVMQRVKEDGEMAVRRFYADQQREEEEKMAATQAFQQWQKDMKKKTERERKEREEKEKQREHDRELQHYREYQVERHQSEIQQHADEKRRRQLAAKSAAGSRRYDSAIRIRQQQRKDHRELENDTAAARLHELEEQERNASERFRAYQDYKRMRGAETSSHVKQVQHRAKMIEQDRLRAVEERQYHEKMKTQQWKQNFGDVRHQKRQQFNSQRNHEKDAKKRAQESEQDRKQRAHIVLEWLNARSQQQLQILDQQRAVKQYEQHVMNAAMKRRADRAKDSQNIRNAQTHAEWTQKMDQGSERVRQREQMTKRSRLEKERLAVLAQRMRYAASTGKKVDMGPMDKVLKDIEKETQQHSSPHTPSPGSQRR